MSKTHLLKTKFLLMGKKSKVPLSVGNGCKVLKKVVLVMFFSILNTLYHVWAYESELGLRYGDACLILCQKY